jgi:hypothetical protein
MTTLKIVAVTFAGGTAVGLGMLAAAQLLWGVATRDAMRELRESSTVRELPARFDLAEVRELPAPVVRYFAFALSPGQPIPAGARLLQHGTFAMRPNEWSSFSAVEEFVVGPPGFVWDARISMKPFGSVRVRDRYRDADGSMLAKFAALVPVVDQRGTPEMAMASLQRYLAEAPWLPTALLPSAGVVWSAIDDSTARASLVDRGVSAAIDVHFAPTGEIVRVTAMRYRDVDGHPVLTAWEGRAFDYQRVNGMMVPLRNEVGWHLPDGWTPYWRAETVHARLDVSIDED